jgi:hypothetical protein
VRQPLLALALIGLAGCPKQPAAVVQAPPPPPSPRVPAGCETSLSGTYRHHDDETFRYQVSDDGHQVRIHAFRQFGATEQPIASSAADITLERTPQGLRGSATTQAPTLSGARTCTVSFPYEVSACSPTQITLRTLHEVRLTESCQPEDALHPDFVENVLVREPQAPDAGAADAGAEPDSGASAVGVDAGLALDSGAATLLDAGMVSTASDAGPAAPLQVADAGLALGAGAAMPADAGAAPSESPSVTHGVAADAGNAAAP